jgi:hypothetical protein
VAFFFCTVKIRLCLARQKKSKKKVGVPADFDLVSTKKGDARVGEAIPERLEMTRR